MDVPVPGSVAANPPKFLGWSTYIVYDIAGEVAERVRNTWPSEVLAAIGAFPDFPEPEELRLGYGDDTDREPLV